MPDMAAVTAWRAMEAAIKAAEEGIRLLAQERDALEGLLLDQFAEDGLHSVRVTSPAAEAVEYYIGAIADHARASIPDLGATQTVYLRTQWVGAVARDEDGIPRTDEFLRVMRQAGYASLIKEGINYQTLNAWLREQVPEGGLEPQVPPFLDGIVSAIKRVELSARKG